MLRGRIVAELAGSRRDARDLLGAAMTGARRLGAQRWTLASGLARTRAPGPARRCSSLRRSSRRARRVVVAALRPRGVRRRPGRRSCARPTLAYGSRPASIVAILNKAITYYLAGIAAAIGFRMLLFNIGIDGQYRLAVFAAAVVGRRGGAAGAAPRRAQIVVAMVVGAAWAAIAGLLKALPRRDRGHQHDHAQRHRHRHHRVAPDARAARACRPPGSNNITTAPIPQSGRLPGFATDAGEIYGFLVVAVAVGIGYWVLLNRTRVRLRAAGERPVAAGGGRERRGRAADDRGHDDPLGRRRRASSACPSCWARRHQYGLDFPAGFGLTGLAIALLGRNHPVGIALGRAAVGGDGAVGPDPGPAGRLARDRDDHAGGHRAGDRGRLRAGPPGQPAPPGPLGRRGRGNGRSCRPGAGPRRGGPGVAVA